MLNQFCFQNVTAAIKAGMAGKKDVGLRPAVDVINLGQGNVDPMMAISLEPPMHDEL